MIAIEIEGIAESYDDLDHLLVDRSGEVRRVLDESGSFGRVEPGRYTVWLVHKVAPVVTDEQRSNGFTWREKTGFRSLPPGTTRLELLGIQHHFENGDINEVDIEADAERIVKCRDCAKQVDKDAVFYTPHMKLPLCKECHVVHGDGVEYDHQVWFEIHGPDADIPAAWPNW